jgi:hypothetical protein
MFGSTAFIKMDEAGKSYHFINVIIQHNVYKISVAIHISFACAGWWVKYNEI